MLRQRTYTTITPSPFTGKEKDPETGYSYFGARYLDHELMTCWLSVDPMSDKYPGISPYAYCAWNPVRLVDPDGNWPWNPKHIRKARRFARHTDGKLTIFTNIDGTKLATVTYTNRSKEGEHIFSIALFQPEGYSVHGTIRKASGFSGFELWLDSPSDNFGNSLTKCAIASLYSIPNDAFILFTGHSFGGNEKNSIEKGEALGTTFSNFFGTTLKSTKIITKTSGTRGLQGYNEFVKANPGILRSHAKQSVGKMYKKNIEIQESVVKSDRISNTIQLFKGGNNCGE